MTDPLARAWAGSLRSSVSLRSQSSSSSAGSSSSTSNPTFPSARPGSDSRLIPPRHSSPVSSRTSLGKHHHLSTHSPTQSPPPHPSAGVGTTQLSPDIMLRCTIFDSSGSAKSTSGVFKKYSLCFEHGLEPRDLRKIDSRVPNLVPTILARRGGILVNILHIRAMIKKDKVLLFDSYGSTDSQLHSAFVYNLQHNLKPPQHPQQQTSNNNSGGGNTESHVGLAYEFRALESILVSVLDALRIELDVVRSWTSQILIELDDDVDRDKLRILLQVSRKLNAFLSRAKAVKNAVVEVLENEEDMQLMYLSSPPPQQQQQQQQQYTNTSFGGATNAQNPSSSTTANSASNTSAQTGSQPTSSSMPSDSVGGLDQLELLLESFDKQVEEVVAETSQLHSDITNTQEVVELILDNNRNKLLALDLKTSIATMGISAGTLWAGLFGMNLKSHMEELDWAFTIVSGVAFLAVGMTAGIGLRRLERLRRVGLGQKLPAPRAAQRARTLPGASWWKNRGGNGSPNNGNAVGSAEQFGSPAHGFPSLAFAGYPSAASYYGGGHGGSGGWMMDGHSFYPHHPPQQQSSSAFGQPSGSPFIPSHGNPTATVSQPPPPIPHPYPSSFSSLFSNTSSQAEDLDVGGAEPILKPTTDAPNSKTKIKKEQPYFDSNVQNFSRTSTALAGAGGQGTNFDTNVGLGQGVGLGLGLGLGLGGKWNRKKKPSRPQM